jgi:hypothetical protein
MTMIDRKKSDVETPVVAGPVVSQAIPSMVDTTKAIAPDPQPAPIFLSQVPRTVPAEKQPADKAAPLGKKK